MNKFLVFMVVSCVNVLGPQIVQSAPIISVVSQPPPPNNQLPKVHIPGNVFVNINISGLGSDILGAFDLDVVYNPDFLVFTLGLSSPGTALGTLSQGEAIADLDSSTPGIINFAEVSLLEASALDALQNDTFTLATLGFFAPTLPPAINQIATTIGAGNFIFSDALGNEIVPQNPSAGAAILLVPIPSTWLLFSVGLIGLWVTCRKRKMFAP
ncbi:MAG: PEP-CTERM sorting domain-containing protein [Candidatus Binatia bacterium]